MCGGGAVRTDWICSTSKEQLARKNGHSQGINARFEVRGARFEVGNSSIEPRALYNVYLIPASCILASNG